MSDDFDIIDVIETGVRDAMPELGSFFCDVRPGLVLFDSNQLRIDTPHGSRAFRDDDITRFERVVTELARTGIAGNVQPLVRIDRVYELDWSSFTEATWKDLDARYQRTRGWIAANDLARWFSADESQIPHLWASVEPSGLQVAGIVDERLLAEWHESFVASIAGLPCRAETSA